MQLQCWQGDELLFSLWRKASMKRHLNKRDKHLLAQLLRFNGRGFLPVCLKCQESWEKYFPVRDALKCGCLNCWEERWRNAL